MKDSNPHVVLDSNKIERCSIIEHEYSPNGKYCAFTISVQNQISNEVFVIDVETGQTHGNSLKLYCFEKIAWSGDSNGFFIFVRTVFVTFSFIILINIISSMIQKERKRDMFIIIL